mmetsp:Transcript_17439/g.47674  ORF Transcript_17439/g.47674 Transcript_17439/m.47674 type:complete len:308 (-) Transcript_17439:986-1909(-)
MPRGVSVPRAQSVAIVIPLLLPCGVASLDVFDLGHQFILLGISAASGGANSNRGRTHCNGTLATTITCPKVLATAAASPGVLVEARHSRANVGEVIAFAIANERHCTGLFRQLFHFLFAGPEQFDVAAPDFLSLHCLESQLRGFGAMERRVRLTRRLALPIPCEEYLRLVDVEIREEFNNLHDVALERDAAEPNDPAGCGLCDHWRLSLVVCLEESPDGVDGLSGGVVAPSVHGVAELFPLLPAIPATPLNALHTRHELVLLEVASDRLDGCGMACRLSGLFVAGPEQLNVTAPDFILLFLLQSPSG